MARCGSPYRTELRTMGSRSESLSCGQTYSSLSLEAHGGSPEGEWDSVCGQRSWTVLMGCAAPWGQGTWWTRALLPLPPDAAPHGDAATCLHPRTLRPTGSGTQPGSDLARPGPACPLSTPHHSQHCGQAAGRSHQLQASSCRQLAATADRGEGLRDNHGFVPSFQRTFTQNNRAHVGAMASPSSVPKATRWQLLTPLALLAALHLHTPASSPPPRPAPLRSLPHAFNSVCCFEPCSGHWTTSLLNLSSCCAVYFEGFMLPPQRAGLGFQNSGGLSPSTAQCVLPRGSVLPDLTGAVLSVSTR